MTIDLYYSPASSPSRAVLLTAKAINLELNVTKLDLQQKEQLTPEYIKLNPQHIVPTLVDNGFAIWESRAIMTYLVTKYGKGSGLYPEDPKVRAVVDQRLYFDMGTLGSRFADYFYPQFMGGAAPDSAKREKVEEALQFLNTFLEGQKFVASSELTVADITLVATVSNLELSDIDFKKYPNINRWYESMKTTVPGYEEINQAALDSLKELLSSRLKK